MEGGTYMATITQMTGAARSIYSSLYANNSRTDATAALFGGPQAQRRRSWAVLARLLNREVHWAMKPLREVPTAELEAQAVRTSRTDRKRMGFIAGFLSGWGQVATTSLRLPEKGWG